MKKTIIALMALAGAACGAELVTELKLDGNFSDTQNNISFNTSEVGQMSWGTESPIAGSDGYLTSSNGKAVWDGDFTTVPSNQNFAITLFVNPNSYFTFSQNNNANAVPGWAAQWFIGGGTTGDSGIKLGIGVDGQVKLDIKNQFSFASGSDNVITLNEWTQVGLAVTKNEGTSTYAYTLFINGEAVASVDKAVTANWRDGNFAILEGADYVENNKRFDGSVDEIQFYNVTDLADATAVMQAQASRIIPEPATATLSLLALCGLAARRRRK